MFINDLFNDKDKTLNEVSNELLGRYKKAAGADASAADKRGDIERGNKRFKGIVKATVKQGENDVKKHKAQGMAEGAATVPWNAVVEAILYDQFDTLMDRYGLTFDDIEHIVRQHGFDSTDEVKAEYGQDLEEAYDTGEGNREYFDNVQEWAQTVKDAGGDVIKARGVYVAHGWEGELGEFNPATSKGWLVSKMFEQGVAEGSSILDILDVPEKVLRTAQDVARGMPTGTVPGGKDDLGSTAGDLANTATKVGKQVIDTARDAARGMPTGTVPKSQKDKGVDEDNSYMDSRPSSVTAKQADELGAAAKRAFKPEYYEPDTEPAPKRRDWDYSDPDIQPIVKDYLNKNVMDKKPMTYVDKVDESRCNMTEQGRSCPAHGIMECPGYSRLMDEAFKMPPESVQDRMHRRHQEIRKKRGLPDPSHYKELAKKKQEEIDALRAEIAADKAKGLTEERYLEELERAGYEIVNEKKIKQRLDPKCWTGYKKQGTKIKGGVRVNNCVPKK